MNINSYDPNPSGIRNAVIVVVSGCFLTRLVVRYFNIINVKFRAEKDANLDEISKDDSTPVETVSNTNQ